MLKGTVQRLEAGAAEADRSGGAGAEVATLRAAVQQLEASNTKEAVHAKEASSEAAVLKETVQQLEEAAAAKLGRDGTGEASPETAAAATEGDAKAGDADLRSKLRAAEQKAKEQEQRCKALQKRHEVAPLETLRSENPKPDYSPKP
eukprot:9475324-Pyramimonas_sp.AAC.1